MLANVGNCWQLLAMLATVGNCYRLNNVTFTSLLRWLVVAWWLVCKTFFFVVFCWKVWCLVYQKVFFGVIKYFFSVKAVLIIWKISYGHTILKTPDPVRSPQLSNIWTSQYYGGGPHGNTGCCNFFNFFYVKLRQLFFAN